MNIKKKLKQFFTLQHRSNDGFTLVELIVVIAILAILAGVGSVGYAGYIKSANKGADKTLVGNVMRAIETGTYSTMFNLDNSFALGGIAYPVGYVVLSPDANAQTKASSVQANEVSGECEFVSATVISLEKTNKTYNCSTPLCPGSDNGDIYTKTTEDVRYCKTHSKNQPTVLTESASYPTDYTLKYDTFWGVHTDHYVEETGTAVSVSAGDYVAENGTSQLYEEQSDGKCIFAANNGVVAGNIVTDAEGKNPIYESLVAAFGEGVPGTNLKYDGWTTDDGVDYATLLNDTGSMIQMVQDTYETLDTMLGIIDTVNKMPEINIDTSNYLSHDYTDASNMMESFANHVIEKHPNQDAWKQTWNNAASYSGVDYTYGMTDSKYHHDFVYSATKSYNQSFASYCESNGVDPTYTAAIINFTSTPNESGLSDIGMLNSIPRTVNSAAFNGVTGVNPNYTLQKKFRDISNSDTDEQADAAFNQCKALYAKYIDDSNGPSACEKNGEVFYEMMNTLDKTGGAARDTSNHAGGDYFNYYKNYLDSMSAIYSGVASAVKDGNIVVLVTVEDGLVKCDVSPNAANPRND